MKIHQEGFTFSKARQSDREAGSEKRELERKGVSPRFINTEIIFLGESFRFLRTGTLLLTLFFLFFLSLNENSFPPLALDVSSSSSSVSR
jgi:hypothetical protein